MFHIKAGKLFAAMLISVASLFLYVACSGDDDQDEEEITKALANRLTDALEFENGERVKGEPPSEHEAQQAAAKRSPIVAVARAQSDANRQYPQVTGFNAPSLLALGQQFTVTLYTDFEQPENVQGAVLHVRKSDYYIEVAAPLDTGALMMQLIGRLLVYEELAGRTFEIDVAMQDMNGDVGNYVAWRLEIPDLSDDDGGPDDDSDYGDDAIVPGYMYDCVPKGFDCSDDEALDYVEFFSRIGNDQAVCEGPYNDCTSACATDDSPCYEACSEEYAGCLACAYDGALAEMPLSREKSVECQACIMCQDPEETCDSAATRVEAEQTVQEYYDYAAECQQ